MLISFCKGVTWLPKDKGRGASPRDLFLHAWRKGAKVTAFSHQKVEAKPAASAFSDSYRKLHKGRIFSRSHSQHRHKPDAQDVTGKENFNYAHLGLKKSLAGQRSLRADISERQ